MNIDKKIIMGVRNKNADAKKELISLTRNHLVQTIYKQLYWFRGKRNQ